MNLKDLELKQNITIIDLANYLLKEKGHQNFEIQVEGNLEPCVVSNGEYHYFPKYVDFTPTSLVNVIDYDTAKHDDLYLIADVKLV